MSLLFVGKHVQWWWAWEAQTQPVVFLIQNFELYVWTGGITLMIIIIEICKAPTLRLKALNKHSTMYIKMEMLSAIRKRKREKKKELHYTYYSKVGKRCLLIKYYF